MIMTRSAKLVFREWDAGALSQEVNSRALGLQAANSRANLMERNLIAYSSHVREKTFDFTKKSKLSFTKRVWRYIIRKPPAMFNIVYSRSCS